MNRHDRRAAQSQQLKTPDPFKIYMNAERYRIADHVLRSPHNDPRIMPSISGPTLVLAAFASELYLKCMIALDGHRFNENHNLKQLFALLQQCTQKSMNARWDAYVAQPINTRVYEIMEHHFGPGQVIRRDLAWTLRKGAEGFQKLRYLHEDDALTNSAFFLGDFHMLLRDEILSRRPEWTQHVHSSGMRLAGNIHEEPGTPFDR